MTDKKCLCQYLQLNLADGHATGSAALYLKGLLDMKYYTAEKYCCTD